MLGNTNNPRHYFLLAPSRRLSQGVQSTTRFGIAELLSLAQNRESAMSAITTTQSDALSKIKARYAAKFNALGRAEILASLKKHLSDLYQKNPATHAGKPLPLEFDASIPAQAKLAYYQHPVHCAYRWLFCHPNPLIHPQAKFVVNRQGNLSADINEQDRDLIAVLWLAVLDKNLTPPDGFTHEDLQTQFFKMLSDMNRAHNWDNPRRLNQAGEWEEYDDLEADRPTCNIGVKKRIVQFLAVLLTFKPEERILNENVMKEQFHSFMIAEGREKSLFKKINQFGLNTLKQLKKTLEDFFTIHMGDESECSSQEKGLLKLLSFTTDAINGFVQHAKNHFGAQRIASPTKVKYMNQQFTSYEALIHYFAKNAASIFYDAINEKINSRIKALTPPEKPESKPIKGAKKPQSKGAKRLSGDEMLGSCAEQRTIKKKKLV